MFCKKAVYHLTAIQLTYFFLLLTQLLIPATNKFSKFPHFCNFIIKHLSIEICARHSSSSIFALCGNQAMSWTLGDVYKDNFWRFSV